MQTQLQEILRGTVAGEEARAIVQRCVHCGFCLATCPTYELLGNELDGPRGRIYLIKQVLEGSTPTQRTQEHLDRCLTCRACETTCPSGVEYGRLVDIGRKIVDEKVRRPATERLARYFMRTWLTGPAFVPALRVAQALRMFFPKAVREKIPLRTGSGAYPTRPLARKVLLLSGCVQPALAPNINAATARVLDAIGIETLAPAAAGCCGAIRFHLSDQTGGLDDARKTIDAWWPHIENGVEAIVVNASGCGAMVKDYGHLLRNDAAYAEKASRVSSMTRDLVEIVAQEAASVNVRLRMRMPERVAFHPPCTLQHALKIRGAVEALLVKFGCELVPFPESYLCCGSAGTYSLFQPKLAQQLRERKMNALLSADPDVVLSANMGCILHLAAGSPVPVRHWIEWLDSKL